MNEITLFIKSSSANAERRINPQWTVSQLKTKLVPIVGTPEQYQKLTYEPASSTVPGHVFTSEEENLDLGEFKLQPLGTIVVEDTRPPHLRLDFDDLSQVDKYVMPREQYENRTDSVYAWKKRNQLGRFNPDFEASKASRQESLKRELVDLQKNLNSRCCAAGERYGTIRYIGLVPEINNDNLWVGVEFDEPVGKNDGSVSGKRYFNAKNKHGSFLRSSEVEVGDFPPEDILEGL
ncbi:Cell polarity protein alp11 [Schizosaccharomyces pombe]